MIEGKDLTKVYRRGSFTIRAVDHADIAVERGEFVMILGRSGSGKSTLLGMLAGLIRPTEGSVRIGEAVISDLKDDAAAGLRAEKIGFVFQFSGLIPTLTARENVMVPTLFCSKRIDRSARAADLLGMVGLSDRADAYPAMLSSGEMKRVAIARSLINEPVILIADEPTGDLDADTENEVMEVFRGLNRTGMTIVMVTHNPDLTRDSSHIYRMDRGALIREGKI